jgi:hypothetical protein
MPGRMPSLLATASTQRTASIANYFFLYRITGAAI